MFLHFQIISGQYFPKPKGSGARGDVTDPYVTIEIFGIPADCAEERTKTVPHNGKYLGVSVPKSSLALVNLNEILEKSGCIADVP